MGVENEKEKQGGEQMEKFFHVVYEFLTDFENFDATNFLCNLQSDSLSFPWPLSSSSGFSSFIPTSLATSYD